MTALPDPTDFATSNTQPAAHAAGLRPKVSEQFWGYEVAMNEQTVNSAVIVRFAVGLLTIGSFVASVGVWLMPASVFGETILSSTLMASVLFFCVSAMLFQIAGRSTRVRVQFDTSVGEVREVVKGPLGGDIVLARYGIDTVSAAHLVESAQERGFGQIQLVLKDGKRIPVGDGALTALRDLRAKIADDCGFESDRGALPAVWSGPHAA